MTDWIDKMIAPLSEGTAPVSEERFEALEKAYVHHVRVRTWRRILVGTAAAALLLIPVLVPVLHRSGGVQDGSGPSSQLAEGAVAVTETAPVPVSEGSIPESAPSAVRMSSSPVPASASASASASSPVVSSVPGSKAPVADSKASAPGPNAPAQAPAASVPSPKAPVAAEDKTAAVEVQKAPGPRTESFADNGLPPVLEDPVVWADPVSVRKQRSRLSIGLLSSTNVSKREQTGVNFPKLGSGTPGTARYCHYAPVSLGVCLDWWRGSRWRLSSGVEMSWYSSEYIQGEMELYEQNVAYLGMPLRVDRVWPFTSGSGAFYAGLGGLVEKGLYGNNGSSRLTPDGWGFSAVGAVGVQYNLPYGIGFYFEPSLVRTLLSPSGRTAASFATYRSNNPLQFALYAGIKFLL